MTQHRSWAFEDVNRFFTLVRYAKASPTIKQSGTLARLLNGNEIGEIEAIIGPTSRLGTTESERYKNYLYKVKESSFGKWLFNHADFRKAHALFKKKCRAPRNFGYQIDLAELRFLQCAAITGFVVLEKEAGSQRKHPNSRQVTQAIKSARKLQSSLAIGVRLNDYSKTRQLNQLLDELLEILKSTKRKPRSDKTSFDRQFVAIVSNQLLENFGDASPGIVIHLARAIGYTADDTAIQAQIRTARSKHKEAKRALVVDALVKAQKKSA